jgi:hypothetical protein
LPILSTAETSKITKTTAISGGNISSEGISAVIVRGVCWSIIENPTVDLSNITVNGSGIGSFSSSITGLTEGTIYYVRAYATNSMGTGYGDQVSFKYEQNLIAFYPLSINGNDELGNNAQMTLTNAPFQNGGIFCNGIYTSCSASTPPINNFTFNSFTISADFLVTENLTQPVFVCGQGCRWLGFYLKADGTVDLFYNNSNHLSSSITYGLNQWNNAKVTYDGTTVNMYLNNILACSVQIQLDYSICGTSDTKIGVTNWSNGQGLKGYYKNLKIYNNAVNDVLNTSVSALSISSAANSTRTFDITSNTSWTVSCSETWLTASKISGSGNATITLTTQANALTSTRLAFVTISGIGVLTRTIAVIQEGIPTGIKKTENDNIKIYPNPTSTKLFINGLTQSTKLSVYNLRGILVLSKHLFDNQIDVSNLTNGIYIIKFENKGGITIRKFIKQ